MPSIRREPDCLFGRHRPGPRRTMGPSGERLSTCRDCGCTLVRRPSAPGWIYTGWLG